LWLTAVTGDGRILGYPDDRCGWASMLQDKRCKGFGVTKWEMLLVFVKNVSFYHVY